MVLIGRNGQGGTESAAPQRTSFLPHCQVHGCIPTVRICQNIVTYTSNFHTATVKENRPTWLWFTRGRPCLTSPARLAGLSTCQHRVSPIRAPRFVPGPGLQIRSPRTGSRRTSQTNIIAPSSALSLTHSPRIPPLTHSNLVTHPSGAGTHHMDMDWPHFQRSGQPRGQA